jgi:threonine/homoserine/homoserine lactone efflux protein
MNWRRIAGWVLVALGALAIVSSMITFYSPSMTEFDLNRQSICQLMELLFGVLLVLLGGILLIEKKGV